MLFNRQFDAGRAVEMEPGGGAQPVLVDQVYETTAHLVQRMVDAGTRLEAARAKGFAEEMEVDPTTVPGFDMADASALAAGVVARMSESTAKAEKAAAEAAAAAQAAQEKLISDAKAVLAAAEVKK